MSTNPKATCVLLSRFARRRPSRNDPAELMLTLQVHCGSWRLRSSVAYEEYEDLRYRLPAERPTISAWTRSGSSSP